MLNYVSVDSAKTMFNVENMEDVTIAYYVFFNYSYTEIVEIYENEIRFKEELLDKYKNCKIQSEFTETKMKEIIEELNPYWKELAIVKGKAREEQAIERQRQIVERFENQERKTIDTSAFICYGD